VATAAPPDRSETANLPVISPETMGHPPVASRYMGSFLDIQAVQDAIGDGDAKGLPFDLKGVTKLLDGTAVDPARLYGALVVGPYPFQSRDTQFRYKRFRGYAPIKSGRATLPIGLLFKTRYNTAGWSDRGTVALRLKLYYEESGEDRFLGLYDTFVSFKHDGKRILKQPTIMEGPLVHLVTSDDPTSAVISLRTDVPTRPTVRLKSGREFQAPTKARWHEVPLTGLKAGTGYRYTVQVGGITSNEFRLKTAPKRGAAHFRFGYAGDARSGMGGGERSIMAVNHRVLEGLFSVAYRNHVDLMLFGGDLINGYTSSVSDFRNQLHSFKQAAAGFWHERPLYTALGNHEALLRSFKSDNPRRPIAMDRWPYATESSEAVFGMELVQPTNGPVPSDARRPTYKENVYSFQYGSLKAIAFNNNYWICKKAEKFGGAPEGYLLADQLAWLKKEIAQAEADPTVRHIVLFAQEPLFPNSGHVKDGMWYHGNNAKRAHILDAKTGKLRPDGPGILEVRDEFLAMVGGSKKVLAVLGSDEHAYHRMRVTDQVPIGNLKTDDPDGNGIVCEGDGPCSGHPAIKHPFWSIVSGGAGAPYYAEMPTPWNRWWRARGEGQVESAHYYFSAQSHVCLFTVNGDKVTLEVLNRFGERIDFVEDLAAVQDLKTTR